MSRFRFVLLSITICVALHSSFATAQETTLKTLYDVNGSLFSFEYPSNWVIVSERYDAVTLCTSGELCSQAVNQATSVPGLVVVNVLAGSPLVTNSPLLRVEEIEEVIINGRHALRVRIAITPPDEEEPTEVFVGFIIFLGDREREPENAITIGASGWFPDDVERFSPQLMPIVNSLQTSVSASAQDTSTDPNCPNLPARLVVGLRGQSIRDGMGATNARPEPGVGQPIFQIQEGEGFLVLDAPICRIARNGDRMRYFRIENDFGQQGWIPEGNDQRYFMEPMGSTSNDTIPPQNAPNLQTSVVGTWNEFIPAVGNVVEWSYITLDADGSVFIFPAVGGSGEGRYRFISPDQIEFDVMWSKEGSTFRDVFVQTIAINGDVMTLTDENGATTYNRRVTEISVVDAVESYPTGLVAFVGTDNRLYTVNSDGSGLEQIASSSPSTCFIAGAMKFSPNGRFLAFPSTNLNELAVRDLTTGEEN